MTQLTRILLVATALTVLMGKASAQPDTSSLAIELNALAFFDNKEFTGNFKKGYTLPGFMVEPTLAYAHGNFALNTGIHVSYLAGSDTTNRFVPLLTLEYSMTPWLKTQVGSLQNSTHGLPEMLYKPERVFMDKPNLGVAFMLNRPKIKADLWMNWERYIVKGSPFQEEFMVGLSGGYRANGYDAPGGLYANLHNVTIHKGGQIDSCDLPVTSITNIGVNVGYGYAFANQTTVGAEVSGYGSKDISPNPHSEYRSGHALHYKLLLAWKHITAEAGYWESNRFINPRGEELFSSVSTLSSTFNKEKRRLATAKFGYSYHTRSGFGLCFMAGLYADIDQIQQGTSSGTYEYYYTLIMSFGGKLIGIK